MDGNEVIRGRRLTNSESNILNYPDLPIIDEEVLNEVLAPFENQDNLGTIKFENGTELRALSYEPSTNVRRGNRAKIMGMQCYDTETMQWIFMELDITQPIDRYIPEWMFVEWMIRKDDDNES